MSYTLIFVYPTAEYKLHKDRSHVLQFYKIHPLLAYPHEILLPVRSVNIHTQNKLNRGRQKGKDKELPYM